MPRFVDQQKYKKQVGSGQKFKSPLWGDSKAIDSFMSQDKSYSKFKRLVRAGVPDDIRGFIWSKAMRLDELQDYERNYQAALKRVQRDNISPVRGNQYPTFGGEFDPDKFCLTFDGEMAVKNILCVLAHDHPQLEFCPFLPTITAVLMHHLSPDDTMAVINRMIQRSSVEGDWAYFPMYLNDTLTFYSSLTMLIKSKLPKLYKHFIRIGMDVEASPVWIKWLNNLCIDIFPLEVIFRMFDSFLLEGYKILFRYIMAALLLKKSALLDSTSVAKLEGLYEKQPFIANGSDDEQLNKVAFSISYSRSETSKAYVLSRNVSFSEPDSSVSPNEQYMVVGRAMPKMDTPSSIVREEHWAYVWSWIPPRYRIMDLKLLFSTDRHGFNLRTMYNRCQDDEPQLLFIDTLEGQTFGAYLSQSWSKNNDRRRFFGNGETFIFSLAPTCQNYPWVGMAGTKTPEEEKFLNENASLFIMGNPEYMAVGGGGTGYGISLDDTLSRGTTASCFTFKNPPLVPDSVFECHRVEVYTFA